MNPCVELRVDGTYIGHVKSIEYRRDVVLVDESCYREYAAGATVVCDVELVCPMNVVRGWRILNEGEELQKSDEWYSVIEMKWYPLSEFRWKVGETVVDGLFRREALVLR